MPPSAVPANWADLPDEQLLDLRLFLWTCRSSDRGWHGRKRIGELRAELEARELRFPIHFYVSDEWFTPDGHVAMAVPFYLAHPRLERLEKRRCWRSRAATRVVHANPAPRSRARRSTTTTSSGCADSGARSLEVLGALPGVLEPKPYSKNFVQHIDPWYTQSHPDEDFAETFAVWLTPVRLAAAFAGWPALKKLEYMDELMRSLRDRKPLVTDTTRSIRCDASAIRWPHYRRKRQHHGVDHPKVYDRELRQLFSDAPEFAGNMTAARLSAAGAGNVRRVVADWTEIYQYTVDKVIEDMITALGS